MDKLPISYRPDVDGLRAVAIVPVVLFHAFPTLISGGFVGVDVFFVISGFLISSIVFAELKRGEFSFARFYARRICRIFPALVLVLACCLAAAWFVLLTDEYEMLGRHVRGGALYISNFVLRREAGYFDVAAEGKPLLHLWSLAIEEQFYIVWPLAAVLAFRRRWPLFNLLIVLVLLSFAFNVYRLPRNPTATFYLPGTRVWELLIGVVLAHVGQFGWSGWGRRLAAPVAAVPADLRAAIGLTAIAVPMVVLDKTMLFPGWWAAAPTLGTALVISAGPSAWFNRVALSHRAMVAIGLISYPLYLWHWPLLSLAHIVWRGDLLWMHRLGLVVLSLALAVLTYRAVERPIRFGGMSRKQAAIGLAGICGAVGLVGHLVAAKAVQPYSARFGVGKLLAAAEEWDYPGSMTRLSFQGRTIWRMPGSSGTVLFLGDSNIEQYAPRVQAVLSDAPHRNKTALFLTGGGCPPIPAVTEASHPHCVGLMDVAIEAADHYGADTVVVGALWWVYFSANTYKVGGLPMPDPQATDAALASLGETLRRLSAKGRRVFLVQNIPTGGELDPRSRVVRSAMTFAVRNSAIPLARLENTYGAISRRIADVARGAGAVVIDPLPYLCGADGLCPPDDANGDPMYKDPEHLRPTYVRHQVRFLDVTLRNDASP